MTTWIKHRRDEIDRAVDFEGVLNDGEGINSIQNVIITDWEGNDVSSEFGSPTGDINGTEVELTFGAAQSDTDQDAAGQPYRVLVEIRTSDGEDKVSTNKAGKVPTLRVSQDGEPGA